MGMIQIRNVPDDLHRNLKAKAAKLGMSLSDYLLGEVHRSADRLSMDEWLERVKRLPPVGAQESSADIIREMRGPLGPQLEEDDGPVTNVEIIRQIRGPLGPG